MSVRRRIVIETDLKDQASTKIRLLKSGLLSLEETSKKIFTTIENGTRRVTTVTEKFIRVKDASSKKLLMEQRYVERVTEEHRRFLDVLREGADRAARFGRRLGFMAFILGWSTRRLLRGFTNLGKRFVKFVREIGNVDKAMKWLNETMTNLLMAGISLNVVGFDLIDVFMQWQEAAIQFQGQLARIMAFLGPLAVGLLRLVTPAVEKFADALSEIGPDIIRNILRVAEAFISKLTPALLKLLDRLPELIERLVVLAPAFASLATGLIQGYEWMLKFAAAVTKVVPNAEGLWTFLGKLLAVFMAIGTPLSVIGTAMSSFAMILGGVIDLARDLADRLGGVIQGFGEAAGSVLDFIPGLNVVGNIFSNLLDIFRDTDRGISSVGMAVLSLAGIFGIFASSLALGGDKLGEFTGSILNMLGTLKPAFDTLSEWIIDAANGVVKVLNENLVKPLSNWWEEKVKPKWESFKAGDFIVDWLDKITKNFDTWWTENLAPRLDEIMEDMSKAISEAWNPINDFLKEKWSQIKQWFIGCVVPELRDVLNLVTSSINNLIDSINSFSKTLGDIDVSDALDDLRRLANSLEVIVDFLERAEKLWSKLTGWTKNLPRLGTPPPEGGPTSIPSYQTGGIVPFTGLYRLHAGELVLPRRELQNITMNVTINIESVAGLEDLSALEDAISNALAEAVRRRLP